jgi:hypothetical protein
LKKEDKETRYFIDLDLEKRTILNWDYDQRNELVQELPKPKQRVVITKGQYNKLVEKAKVWLLLLFIANSLCQWGHPAKSSSPYGVCDITSLVGVFQGVVGFA